MAKPDFLNKVSDDDNHVQVNLLLSPETKVWLKKTANKLGKSQSMLARQIFKWAQDEAERFGL